jgi:hypothetical protein
MARQFNEITFNDIEDIDTRAIYDWQESSTATFLKNSIVLLLTPLSNISISQYLYNVKNFLIQIFENLFKIFLGVLYFFKIFNFQNPSFNLMLSLTNLWDGFKYLILDTLEFAIFTTLTILSLPTRLLSSLICYAPALYNHYVNDEIEESLRKKP